MLTENQNNMQKKYKTYKNNYTESRYTFRDTVCLDYNTFRFLFFPVIRLLFHSYLFYLSTYLSNLCVWFFSFKISLKMYPFAYMSTYPIYIIHVFIYLSLCISINLYIYIYVSIYLYNLFLSCAISLYIWLTQLTMWCQSTREQFSSVFLLIFHYILISV